MVAWFCVAAGEREPRGRRAEAESVGGLGLPEEEEGCACGAHSEDVSTHR